MNSTLPGMEKPLIKVAVPNKGSLSEPAAEMLREAGYAQRSDGELALLDEANGVEFFYLRPRDIAVYVGEGTLDVGITGRDMLLDSRAHAIEVMPLGFGRSRFRFAAPHGQQHVGRAATRSSAGDLLPRAGRVLSRRSWCQHSADRAGRRGRDRHPARRCRRDR